ncbi:MULTISPECIES: NUDIX hydrolase [unclassified Paenibacillus]|uniref:NUDIX hydrolase n=1 Tax=unclassified Paenibacillus TaxID=185978 RepID=UPI000CFD11CE|nr:MULTISPECIES: NUDIX domain-containing protein [unclassified Paenibacillus]MBD8836969.1 NUDIX domain-containing protein [Paenibacillus sp. CFBP 13594]PRA07779.1 ADP-ribose pyrophosphatase [Paenibacillus sp. MYb63]PRA51424.1 ADP-ribose pyrophosphatase [Paenibacillus sp. MYb67]QZN74550.1 NUDIX domain-containing protein [Paenibacillus sp. DR312]
MAFPTHIVSAGGIVEDGTGNILLVKAHDDGWVYPGGITEVGENLIDGVIREIKEESGIVATVSHLISVVSNTAIHKWYDGVTDVPTKVMFDFVCKAVGGELATSNETSECRWVPKESVLDLVTLPGIRMRYEAYLNFNGSVNYMEYVTASTIEFDVKLQRSV